MTIIVGDAIEAMGAVEDESLEVVLTDPPYSSGTRREGAKGIRKSMNRESHGEDWFGTDSLTTVGFAHLLRVAAIEWRRVLKPGGHVLAFIDWRMGPHLAGAIESADLRQVGELVWDKDTFGMGRYFRQQNERILHFTKGIGAEPVRRDVGNVLRCPSVRGGEHPTEKPVALLRRLLSVVARPGATVLDNFAGSGSTGVAAILEGMSPILIERDERWAGVALRRCNEARAQGSLSLGSSDGAALDLPGVA